MSFQRQKQDVKRWCFHMRKCSISVEQRWQDSVLLLRGTQGWGPGHIVWAARGTAGWSPVALWSHHSWKGRFLGKWWNRLWWVDLGWGPGVHQSHSIPPLFCWAGERKCNERLLSRDEDRERSLPSYCHGQNRLNLGEKLINYWSKQSRIMRNKTKS